MKDNLNIEKLFQEKLGGLEADVSPDLFGKIQQSLGANASAGAAAKTGMSLMLKKVLIGTGIVAAGITGIYLATPPEEVTNDSNDQIAQNETITNETLIENTTTNENLVVETLIDEETNDSNHEENAVGVNENGENQTTNTNNNEGDVDNGSNTSSDNQNNSSTDGVSNTDENQNENSVNQNENTTNETVTDTDNGNNNENTTVIATPTGNMEINAKSYNIPSEVNFKANAKNATSIVWNFGDGESAQGESVKHVYSQPGDYSVTLTVLGEGELNYSESQKVEITTKSGIDNIPNVFTPDGDRINDLFSIKATEINTFYMVIYDLRGNKVYETQDAEFIWDGTDLGGNPVQKGIYTYMIKAEGTDGAIFSIPGEVQVR